MIDKMTEWKETSSTKTEMTLNNQTKPNLTKLNHLTQNTLVQSFPWTSEDWKKSPSSRNKRRVYYLKNTVRCCAKEILSRLISGLKKSFIWIDELAGYSTYVLHEFPAHRPDFLAEGGTEHHHLFLNWGHSKYLLYVSSHIWEIKLQLVAYLRNKVTISLLELNRKLTFHMSYMKFYIYYSESKIVYLN